MYVDNIEYLHELLLKKDRQIEGLDQLRKDNIEKIERLQKYQTELEKEIKFLKEKLRDLGAGA